MREWVPEVSHLDGWIPVWTNRKVQTPNTLDFWLERMIPEAWHFRNASNTLKCNYRFRNVNTEETLPFELFGI